ncbi:hypothetical protein [Streptomyces sp. NPDC056682]|uniref:hypothetical protein n=1 Tax=Streptomyces sp. NPDC056682 TaxID=3345909 RepID=UPI0036A98DE7
MSRSAAAVTALTWGALVIEIAIGVCVLASDRWRKAGMVMDIVLHGSIILTMGLWSFAVVMIGSAIVCATPERGRPERASDSPPAEPKVRHCAECGALPMVAAVP